MNFLVNLDVDDLDAAIRFYAAAFGFTAGRRIGGTAVEMLGGPTPLYLLDKRAGSLAAETTGEVRHYGRHWTPAHLDFIVEEIDGAVEKAMAAGARLERPVTVHAWGKLALMADPFGHGFCFIQFLGRGYDEIADQIADQPASLCR
jgi:catechol 2,3-dioxygenase-like lactoylglutathione lyase family enzyme